MTSHFISRVGVFVFAGYWVRQENYLIHKSISMSRCVCCSPLLLWICPYIQKLRLFCFANYGLFVKSWRSALLTRLKMAHSVSQSLSRPTLSKYRMVSRCTLVCNSICTHKKSTAFPVPVYTKLTIYQLNCMQVSRAEYNPRLGTSLRKYAYWLKLLSKFRLSLQRFWRNLW